MKELNFGSLLAVFHEMLGIWLWVIIVAAVIVTALFISVLIREKGIIAKHLVRAQLLGLIGGAAALIIMAKVSSSGFTDAGGPIDWLLIMGVFTVGYIGAVILFYTSFGLLHRRGASSGRKNASLSN